MYNPKESVIAMETGPIRNIFRIYLTPELWLLNMKTKKNGNFKKIWKEYFFSQI